MVIAAEVSSLRENLVAGYCLKLVSNGLLVIDPALLRINAEDEEVYQRDDVISPGETHLSKCILARKYDISFERNILLELQMCSILIQVLLGDSKIDEVDFIDESVAFFVISDHNVIRFKITMDEAFIVEHLEKVYEPDAH